MLHGVTKLATHITNVEIEFGSKSHYIWSWIQVPKSSNWNILSMS